MFSNGQAYAIMRRARLGHLRPWFGVPRYLFRQAVQDAAQWVKSVILRKIRAAFLHELYLWACIGFMTQRWIEQI